MIKSNLEEEGFIWLILQRGTLLSGLPTSPYLASSFYIFQDHILRDWFCPQWAGLSSIKIKAILYVYGHWPI